MLGFLLVASVAMAAETGDVFGHLYDCQKLSGAKVLPVALDIYAPAHANSNTSQFLTVAKQGPKHERKKVARIGVATEVERDGRGFVELHPVVTDLTLTFETSAPSENKSFEAQLRNRAGEIVGVYGCERE
jgi:hypothetical protein